MLTTRSISTIHIPTIVVLILSCTQCIGQVLTTRTMLEQEPQWKEWADTKHKLQVSVRYEGRASRNFRVYRLPIMFIPPRGSELPQRMKSGQRLNISGHLRRNASEYQFIISRLDIQLTDRDWLADRAAAIPNSMPEKLYSLADEFAQIADFFRDDNLMADVTSLRLKAFNQQQTQFQNNADQLWQLAEHGIKLGISTRLINGVRFQALVLRHKQKQSTEQLAKDIKANLPGWDKPQLNISAIQLSQFKIAPANTYQQANDENRQVLHRLFFRQVRLPELRKLLAESGSNGIDVAKQIREELPEETEAVSDCEQAFVDYKMDQITKLTRPQLIELITLLDRYSRREQIEATIDKWLSTLEQQFANRGLQGQLRTADEYLFAWEEWKNTKHRDKAVEYLKQAWQTASEVAPAEAVPIAQRLERLGWVRLHERWMTNEQIGMLPKSDIQLAMREGRVVKGMTPAQVSSTLGSPARIVRVVSGRHFQEIWVYQTAGASGISVHLRRGRSQKPSEAVVILISQISATPISTR